MAKKAESAKEVKKTPEKKVKTVSAAPKAKEPASEKKSASSKKSASEVKQELKTAPVKSVKADTKSAEKLKSKTAVKAEEKKDPASNKTAAPKKAEEKKAAPAPKKAEVKTVEKKAETKVEEKKSPAPKKAETKVEEKKAPAPKKAETKVEEKKVPAKKAETKVEEKKAPAAKKAETKVEEKKSPAPKKVQAKVEEKKVPAAKKAEVKVEEQKAPVAAETIKAAAPKKPVKKGKLTLLSVPQVQPEEPEKAVAPVPVAAPVAPVQMALPDIPETEEEEDFSDDNELSADASPGPLVHRRLKIKKVSAPPTKFLPKFPVNADIVPVIANDDEDAVETKEEAAPGHTMTKMEKESARKNALDTKLLVGPKNDTMKVYMGEIARISLVNKNEEAELAQAIHSHDSKRYELARNTLIKANLRLVVKIAHDFKGLGLPLLDLISEGNIGLMRAVEKFDPDKGAKFSSYAAWWIKQSMRRALANQSRTIRIPVQSAGKIAKIKTVRMRLTEELGRDPTDSEIAEHLDFSERTVAGLRLADLKTISLHDPIQQGEEGEFQDIIPDRHAMTPDQIIGDVESVFRLLDLLDKLDIRERKILEMRFGLRGSRPLTLEEVSQQIGRTRERVRQIQNQALSKLKQLLVDEAGFNGNSED